MQSAVKICLNLSNTFYYNDNAFGWVCVCFWCILSQYFNYAVHNTIQQCLTRAWLHLWQETLASPTELFWEDPQFKLTNINVKNNMYQKLNTAKSKNSPVWMSRFRLKLICTKSILIWNKTWFSCHEKQARKTFSADPNPRRARPKRVVEHKAYRGLTPLSP